MQYYFMDERYQYGSALSGSDERRQQEYAVQQAIVQRLSGRKVSIPETITVCAEEIDRTFLGRLDTRVENDLWLRLGEVLEPMQMLPTPKIDVEELFAASTLAPPAVLQAIFHEWTLKYAKSASRLGLYADAFSRIQTFLQAPAMFEPCVVHRWARLFDEEAKRLAREASKEQLHEATQLPWFVALFQQHPAEAMSESVLRRLVQDNARVVFAALLCRFLQVRGQNLQGLSQPDWARPTVVADLLTKSVGPQERLSQLPARRTLSRVFN